jgi:hypothetical protein
VSSSHKSPSVAKTAEQIDTALDVLETVQSLLDTEQRGFDRRNPLDRLRYEVYSLVSLTIRDTERELRNVSSIAHLGGGLAKVDPNLFEMVRRFRAIGPAKLKQALKDRRATERQIGTNALNSRSEEG